MHYDLLIKQYTSLIEDSKDEISLLANTSAFLMQSLQDISWVGFYILKQNQLVLGPFQGKVACTTIPLTKGVCGKAASIKETLVVADVHTFEGHIACDADTNAEIVIPICINDNVYGVLDVDSTSFHRFQQEDTILLEQIASILECTLKNIL